jgi:tRNA A-37 threonylcarbamoyl transferase component Bud32
MSAATDPLSKLSDSIADGEAIDWDAVRALVGDEDIRPLLEHLRVVAAVAEVHRSQIAETIAVTTTPARGPAGAAPVREAPQRWGHLLLVRKIGEGAFGEVYEALDTWLDHPRALKLLKPEIATRASAPQILHEARKLVRIRHPNVVMVHGADSHDGRVGFWMDLIEGQTLEQRVREGRLSAGEATYVGQELCRALAAVHHANLVHRDIKAQNVMRASDGGRIILMDFGAGEFRNEAVTGRLRGTPLYLAPELITGGAATVQSDIYALGVLLYYLVTSRFPVEGKTLIDLALAHAQRARRHLRDARPDLPDTFVSVVERAIDPEPARRFHSAGDFHAALGEREVIRPAVGVTMDGTSEPAPDSQRPLVYTLVAALAVLAAIEVCGFVASRTFEVVLNVHPDFAGGPAEYLTLGRQGLLPFALYWLVGIALVVVLAGVRLALGSRGGRLFGPLRRRLERVSPTSLATFIPVSAAICWLAISWVHWPIVDTLSALHLGTPVKSANVAILDPAFVAMQFTYSQLAAVLSFVLIFAVWRCWPWLERRSDDVSAVRRMKWASVALAVVVVVAAVAPRRFAMEKFEVVLYKNRPSFVIGVRGEELLLYVADSVDTVRPRVRRGDPDVIPTYKLLTLAGL